MYQSLYCYGGPLLCGFNVVTKGPFIATQLNSTPRRVELSCVAINGPYSVKFACTYTHIATIYLELECCERLNRDKLIIIIDILLEKNWPRRRRHRSPVDWRTCWPAAVSPSVPLSLRQANCTLTNTWLSNTLQNAFQQHFQVSTRNRKFKY